MTHFLLGPANESVRQPRTARNAAANKRGRFMRGFSIRGDRISSSDEGWKEQLQRSFSYETDRPLSISNHRQFKTFLLKNGKSFEMTFTTKNLGLNQREKLTSVFRCGDFQGQETRLLGR
jgi:hypothetical protein